MTPPESDALAAGLARGGGVRSEAPAMAAATRLALLRGLLPALALLALLAGIALATRPLLPVDETRYAAVAWEMWLRGDWLVPHLGGVPYSHKGPLLFWLVGLGWGALGVSEAWLRLVPSACAALALVLVAALARLLWPERPRVAALAPLLLLSCGAFAVYSTALITDLPLLALALLAIACIAWAWRRGGVAPWFGFAAAVGLGILTKGPAALLHALPVALAAPLWAGSCRPPSWARWYGALALAALGALALALAWALPAAHFGGQAYGEAILWQQTAGRVVRSFAHAQPWWFYLPVVALLLLPLPLWPRLWQALAAARGARPDDGARFCLAWLLLTLASFSAISGKQVHYLLPLLPGLVLLVARLLDGVPEPADGGDHLLLAAPLWLAGGVLLLLPLVPLVARLFAPPRAVLELLWHAPWWLGPPLLAAGFLAWRRRGRALERAVGELALVVVAVLALAHHAVLGPLRPAYDLAELAAHLAEAQRAGRPTAFAGHYESQFQFPGRLPQPLQEVEARAVAAWFTRHPDGLVVSQWRGDPPLGDPGPVRVQPYRGRTVGVWSRAGFAGAMLARSPALREMTEEGEMP